MASAIYLLNISYAGVPTFEESVTATSEQQDQYSKNIQASFPFLGVAMGTWPIDDTDIINPHLRRQIDDLFVKLFRPGRHSRCWEWRATLYFDLAHPLWRRDYDGMADNVALTIACFFEQPRLVERILQDNQMLVWDTREMALQPDYAQWLIRSIKQDDEFLTLEPPEYLLGGTALEAALKLNATECIEIIAHQTPNLCDYISSAGLSPLSIVLKAPPLTIDDPRCENLLALLRAGASINPHPVSETPLQSAARILHVEAMRLLLKAGALVNQVADDHAVVQNIQQKFQGTPEEVSEAINNRGLKVCYRTPLLIVLDHPKGGPDCEAAEVLREYGGLSLHIFRTRVTRISNMGLETY